MSYFQVYSYSGVVEESGFLPTVYAQLECGCKAGPDEVYVGESCHGHGGRYYGPFSTPHDRLLKGTWVDLVGITSPGVEAERKVLEGLFTDELEAHPLLFRHCVTQRALRGVAPLLDIGVLTAMDESIQVATGLLEEYFCGDHVLPRGYREW